MTITSATGVHIARTYTLPGSKWRVNLNLLTTGQIAGTIIPNKTPVVVIKADDKLYET